MMKGEDSDEVYNKCPIHLTVLSTCHRLGFDSNDILAAIYHYAQRNELLLASVLPAIRESKSVVYTRTATATAMYAKRRQTGKPAYRFHNRVIPRRLSQRLSFSSTLLFLFICDILILISWNGVFFLAVDLPINDHRHTTLYLNRTHPNFRNFSPLPRSHICIAGFAITVTCPRISPLTFCCPSSTPTAIILINN